MQIFVHDSAPELYNICLCMNFESLPLEP